MLLGRTIHRIVFTNIKRQKRLKLEAKKFYEMQLIRMKNLANHLPSREQIYLILILKINTELKYQIAHGKLCE